MPTNFPEKSVATIVSKAHDPVYFDKLSSDYGITARTQQERAQLLELAVVLREQHDLNQVKQATAGNSFLEGAIQSLKSTLSDQGKVSSASGDELRIKAAAARAVTEDNELKEAALEYAAFLASVNGGN